MRKWETSAGATLALIFALFAHPVGAQESSLTPARQKELIYLLRQDCGSCHGLTLEGGLGPTLLPKDLADKSEEWLREVILNGIPETAMPPWRSLLAEPEVDWLVKMMKRGVPDAK